MKLTEALAGLMSIKIQVQLPARRAYSPEGKPGFGPPRRVDMSVYFYRQCSARPGATADVKLDPLCIERSKPYLADTYETRSGPGVSGIRRCQVSGVRFQETI